MSLGASGPPPSVTAGQQQALNRDAILTSAQVNQINQDTPFGSLSFSGTVGEDDRTSTITLSPEIQALIDSQIGTSQGLTDQANIRLGQLTSTPFDINQAGGRRIDLDSTDRFGRPMIRRQEQRPLRGALNDVGGLTRSLDQTGATTSFADVGIASGDIADAGNIQAGLDLGGFGALPTAGDFTTERQRVEDALFQRQAGRINPQFDRDVDRRIEQLANQGITEFSNPVAFEEGLRPFIEGRTDALDRASLGAITGAGAEQSRLFADTLAARQQGVGETVAGGEFFNRAQQQGFQQNLAATSEGRAAQQQNFQQNLARAEFENDARQQIFQQALESGQFENLAQQQAFLQELQGQSFFNEAQNQRFAQDQNILAGDLAAGSFGNATRDSFINELVLQRNQPFNELAAFLQGAPSAPTPNFMQQPAFQMQSADLVGLQASRNNANARAQSGLFGALGSLGAAAIPFAFS